MDYRESTQSSNLELGDIVLIKNHKSHKLDAEAIGPCIFIEYAGPKNTSAVVFYTKSKRMRRVKISHISPVHMV